MKRDLKTQVIGTRAQVIDIAFVGALILVASLIAPIALANASASVTVGAQYFIGPAVNCALIFMAIRVRSNVTSAILICTPSVCTLGLGLIGISGPHAILMVPAIWVGNALLVSAFRGLYNTKKLGFISTSVIAIVAKVGIIFSVYLVLAGNGAFPTPVANMLFSTMGYIQIITGIIGCACAYGLIATRKK